MPKPRLTQIFYHRFTAACLANHHPSSPTTTGGQNPITIHAPPPNLRSNHITPTQLDYATATATRALPLELGIA